MIILKNLDYASEKYWEMQHFNIFSINFERSNYKHYKCNHTDFKKFLVILQS